MKASRMVQLICNNGQLSEFHDRGKNIEKKKREEET